MFFVARQRLHATCSLTRQTVLELVISRSARRLSAVRFRHDYVPGLNPELWLGRSGAHYEHYPCAAFTDDLH